MKTIYKYALPRLGNQPICMSQESRILHVDYQGSSLYMWAEVDTEQCTRHRHFHVHGTGESFDESDCSFNYIGTAVGDRIVSHVYERFYPDMRKVFSVEMDPSKMTQEQRAALLQLGTGQIEAVPKIDPMESVVRWTRYDGTPETLPDPNYEVFICQFFGERKDIHSGFLDPYENPCRYRWINLIHCDLGPVKVDDLWGYLPLPPEGVK